jgi:hypothetical protein
VSAVEWWVMRVVGPDTMKLTRQLADDLERGALAVVNGEVCEPIECYDDRDTAIAKAGKLTRPGRTFKVVMNADLEGLDPQAIVST